MVTSGPAAWGRTTEDPSIIVDMENVAPSENIPPATWDFRSGKWVEWNQDLHNRLSDDRCRNEVV